MKFFRVLLYLVAVLFSFQKLHAHQVPSVELEFQKGEKQWRLLGEMDIAYMLPETRNIPGGPPLSRAAVMKSPPEEFARIRKETENTLRKLLRFTFAGKDIPWRVEYPNFEKEPFVLPPEDGDVALISVRIIFDAVPGGGELRAHWSGEQETELIILIEEGDDPKIMSTLPGGNVLLMNLAAPVSPPPVAPAAPEAHSPPVVVQPPPPALQPVTSGWLQSGFHHVLPTGFDHMLFILGMFLLVPKWKSLLEQSLLFTLAHSITLALSVYGLANVPMNFVNIMVAVSIAWIGVENLVIGRTGKLGKQRLILVFSFGLIHGLGYASGLREKLSSLPQNKLIMPLIGFNAGVELAQITVLAAAFLFFWPLGKWKTQVQTYGSVFVALCGFAWVVQRLFFV
ncbi:MAG: HupE/UreJ family protein [Luteolibacter sp.]